MNSHLMWLLSEVTFFFSPLVLGMDLVLARQALYHRATYTPALLKCFYYEAEFCRITFCLSLLSSWDCRLMLSGLT